MLPILVSPLMTLVQCWSSALIAGLLCLQASADGFDRACQTTVTKLELRRIVKRMAGCRRGNMPVFNADAASNFKRCQQDKGRPSGFEKLAASSQVVSCNHMSNTSVIALVEHHSTRRHLALRTKANNRLVHSCSFTNYTYITY